jgi:hypothetical protein
MRGFICGPPIYCYKGWTFEFHAYAGGGPWPIRKDGEPRKRAGRRFYQVFEEWHDLPDREQYRVGGGCNRFSAQ